MHIPTTNRYLMSCDHPRISDSLKLMYRPNQKPLKKVIGNVNTNEAMWALMAIGPMCNTLWQNIKL